MEFTLDDIRQMVSECLERLYEYHHAPDESISALADAVIEKVKHGGGVISRRTMNKINPYFKENRPLKVIVVKSGFNTLLHGKVNASYNQDDNTIEIVKNNVNLENMGRVKELIMHELSHFVDKNLGNKFNKIIQFNGIQDKYVVFANNFKYLFDPSEIQARLSEYHQHLKEVPEDALEDALEETLNKILFLKQMEGYLKKVKNIDFYSENSEAIYRISKLNYAERIARRDNGPQNINMDNKNGFVSIEQFEDMKNNIVRKAEKRLRSMKNKAYKIKYDAILRLKNQ